MKQSILSGAQAALSFTVLETLLFLNNTVIMHFRRWGEFSVDFEP